MEAAEEPAEPESSRAEAAGRGRGAGCAEPGARSRERGAPAGGAEPRAGPADLGAWPPARPRPGPDPVAARAGGRARPEDVGGRPRRGAAEAGRHHPALERQPAGPVRDQPAHRGTQPAGVPPSPATPFRPPGPPPAPAAPPDPGWPRRAQAERGHLCPGGGRGRRAWRGRLSRVSPPAAGVAALGPGPRTFVTGTREHVTAAAAVGLELGGWRPGA